MPMAIDRLAMSLTRHPRAASTPISTGRSVKDSQNYVADGQSELAIGSKSQLDALTVLVNAQKIALDRFKSSSEFNAALLGSHQSQNERYSLEACRTNALVEELRMANAALKFEKIRIDVSQQRAPVAHEASLDVVLPEWGVDVAVLPPVEQGATPTDFASGRNAPTSEDRNTVSPASGCNAPASEGPTPSPFTSGRRTLAGGGHLPPPASGPNAPACGEVTPLSPSGCNSPARGEVESTNRISAGAVTRSSRADTNLSMIFVAREGQESPSGQWMKHPRTGERLFGSETETDFYKLRDYGLNNPRKLIVQHLLVGATRLRVRITSVPLPLAGATRLHAGGGEAASYLCISRQCALVMNVQ